MTAMNGYDPKPDLDAFYESLAAGTLGGMDPDSVFDLVDRVSAHPGEALRSLGLKPFDGASSETVRRPLLDAYYGRVSSVPPRVDESGPLSRLLDGIEARVRMSPDDIASAFGARDSVAMDRMLETYYRS